VKEGRELEDLFNKPKKSFYPRDHDTSDYELYDHSDELVRVQYPTDYVAMASKLLENRLDPGHVRGALDELHEGVGVTKDGVEVNVPKSAGGFRIPSGRFNFTAASTTSRGTSLPNVGRSSSSNNIYFGRRLLALQGQSPDRWHVNNNAGSPWRRNGRLSMGCTGALIGNRVIITAAHCLYDRETDTYASWPLYFAAGQDGNEKPYGDARVYMRYVPSGYRTCTTASSCRAHDWAILVLYDWAELNVGYFGFSTSIGGSTLNLAGYPQSKNRELWYDHCPLHSDMGKWIKHKCDTEPGNSGSGIYKIKNGSRYVVAVHGGGYAYQWNRGADVDGKTAGSGDRMFDKMLAYRQTYG